MATMRSPIPKSVSKENVGSIMEEYRGYHDEATGGTLENRNQNYSVMINDYYDLVTDFYEYGWGSSFHFAPRKKRESFKESLVRHEYFLADSLELQPGYEVLDLGCGVGGPMRNIARRAGASITGINNNAYQVSKCERYVKKEGLADRCHLVKADFMNIPVTDNRFHAVYTIEASCHAPDRLALFQEVYRVLKPGGQFAGYEWCLTDLYDERDAEHRAIKKGIEAGDALPDILHTGQIVKLLEEAGFDVADHADLALSSDPERPWYMTIEGRDVSSLTSLLCTRPGRHMTHFMIAMLEKISIAPKGSRALSSLLMATAEYLVEGGKRGIFTPMFYFRARKPSS